MKLQKTLVAAATGATLCLAGTNASALNLGEVWTADQQNGILHVFKQSDLNSPWKDANQQRIDLWAETVAAGQSLNNAKMHISGFTKHPGLSSNSRAVLGYLGGQMQIWKTNGGPAAPTLVSTHEVSTTAIGSGANSLHMCGPSPDNSLIGCSSIGNKEITLFSMDVTTDTYTRIGPFPLVGLQIHPDVKGKRLTAVNTAIAAGALNGSAVCNNFDTDSRLLYVTTNIGGNSGGVLVLDVDDPTDPRIRDAVFGDASSGDVRGYGCGLLNSPDGKYMFTNVGNNSGTDVEGVLRWKHARAYRNNKGGPVDQVFMTQEDNSAEAVPGQSDDYAVKSGDAHGAELAGLGSGFMWEVQRVDDNIQVLPTYGPLAVVNKFTVETAADPNPAPDVLDRSALGTRMYVSTRGAIPITAIPSLKDNRRTPSVMVLGTLFGFNGTVLKQEELNCVGTPTAPHSTGCTTTLGGVTVNTSDPHGLKSLSYITGGF